MESDNPNVTPVFIWADALGSPVDLPGLQENTAEALRAWLTTRRVFPGHSTLGSGLNGYDGTITVKAIPRDPYLVHPSSETITYEVLGQPYGETTPRSTMTVSRQGAKAAESDSGARPSVEPLLQFFAYQHLPPHLQETSRLFGELAARLVEVLPRNAERTVALRKLLESKDCAVRAKLMR